MNNNEKYDGAAEGFEPRVYVELMTKVRKALDELVAYCEEYNIDAQDYITADYPFEQSLDEVACEVCGWCETAEEILKRREKMDLNTYEAPEVRIYEVEPVECDYEKMRVEIIHYPSEHYAQAWLYSVQCGIKELMWGENYETNHHSFEDYIKMVLINVDDYAKDYMKDYYG